MGRARVFVPILLLVINGQAQQAPSAASANSLAATSNQAAPSFFSTRTDSPTGATPRGIAALDYNADGKLDVAVVNAADNTVSLLKGNGTGAFAGDQVYAVTPPVAIGARDFDEDGQLDLVVSNQGFDIGAGYVMFSRLKQPPPKTTLGNLGTSDTGLQLAGADLNGDGHQDFAVVSPLGSAVTVVLCNGNATCRPATSYTVGSFPRGVASGDFNGDGKVDLVVSLSGENSVGVLLNSGGGAFAAPLKYATGNSPTWVVTGDFSGDGKPDIAVVNSGAGTVSVLINNGDGTFKPKVDYAAGSSAMVAGDFNGDGKLDLAVTNETANTVSILLGNVDGTFQAALTLPAGNGPRNIVAADFDGDGKLDLAVTNSTGNTVSVWLNRQSAAPATHFIVSTQATAVIGAAFPFTVTAVDASNNVATAYGGTVRFTSTDGAATLPANSTLSGGSGTFAATLKTAGNQTISATDTVTPSITGTSALVAVSSVGQPAPVSVIPASGSASSQAMTFTFTDPQGYQSLNVVNILINNSLDAFHACYLAYSQPANVLYLVADNGVALLPGSVLTSAGSASNSQCAVSWGASPVTASGATLTLALTMGFTTAFAGNKVVYMAAGDVSANNSGWQALGVWQVPGASSATTTSVVGMSPARGNGLTQTTFAFTFSDTKGVQDLGVQNILVNNGLDGAHACYLAYVRPANLLYLVNDNGDALLPGQVLNTSGSFNNSQCAVSWSGTPVSVSGNNLTLILSITFAPAFRGSRIFFLASRDVSEANNTGWNIMGTWTVQ